MKASFVVTSSPAGSTVDGYVASAEGNALFASAQWWEAGGYALTDTRIGGDSSARICMLTHASLGSGGIYTSPHDDAYPSWTPSAPCPVIVFPPAPGVDYSFSNSLHGAASSPGSPTRSVGLSWSSGSSGFALGQVSGEASAARHWLRVVDIYDGDGSLGTFNNRWLTHLNTYGGPGVAADLIATSIYFTTEVPQWTVTSAAVRVTCTGSTSTIDTEPSLAYSITNGGIESDAWAPRSLDATLIVGQSSPWLPLSRQGGAAPFSYWGNLDLQDANALGSFDPGASGIPGGGESVTYALEWRYTVTRDNKVDITPPLHQRQRTGGADDHAMHSGPGSSTRQGGKFARGKL